jgi:acyl-CoA thioesterase I
LAKLIKLYFFGDSVCFGQHVSPHLVFVTRLSALLEEYAAGFDVELEVQNPSVNGNTTRMALERMPYDVQSHHPDILVVQFGMNDSNYWLSDYGHPRVSPQAFESNLEEIVQRAFICGVRRVILNTNHPTGRDLEMMTHADRVYQQSNEEFNQVIRQVAAKFDRNLVLNDIEAGFKAHIRGERAALISKVLPEPDLLHLSVEGHNLYVELTLPLLKAAIHSILKEDRK